MKLQASHHGRQGRHQAPPAVQTWSYRLDKAASYDSNLGNTELVTDVVVNVTIAVAVMATMAWAAEHRAGPSRHRAYRAADHRSDRTADRGSGDDAAGCAHGLRRG